MSAKPIRCVVIASTMRPGLLSLRLADKPDESGTAIKRALAAAGFRPGDVVAIAPAEEAPSQEPSS